MSSSSVTPEPDFNPLICHPVSLEIEHADGTVEVVPDGRGLRLAAGSNISLLVDEDSNQISVAAVSGTPVSDPYYLQKYEALKGLTDANDAGNPVWGPQPLPSGVTPALPEKVTNVVAS